MKKIEDNEDEDNLSSLFISEDYVCRTWNFSFQSEDSIENKLQLPCESITLLCSPMNVVSNCLLYHSFPDDFRRIVHFIVSYVDIAKLFRHRMI